MQIIPTAVPSADAGVGSPAQATSPDSGDTADGGFPELLRQVTPTAPQKTTAKTPADGQASGETPALGIAAEGKDLMTAVDALWSDLSQLALEAQNAFQAAAVPSAKMDVMQGFVSDLQAKLAAFQTTAMGASGTLSTQITTELAQRTSLQIGLSPAGPDGPMQMLETAMGLLRSALPMAAPASPAQTPTAAPIPTAVPGAETVAAQAVMPSEADAAQQTMAGPVPGAAPQAAPNGAVPANPAAVPAVAPATPEPTPEAVATPDLRAAGQGEELPGSMTPETPKAALANAVLGNDAAKPAGPAPTVAQAVAPSAPPTAVPDTTQMLNVDQPASVTARATSDLAPAFSFARNIAAQVRGTTFEEGKTRVELTPRGLGDIEVEVARDDSGKLRVVLRAENAAVLTAFRNDRDMILGMLRDGGVPLEDGEVAFESFGGHGSYQDRGAPRDFEEIEAVVPGAPIADEAPLAASIAARPPVAPTGALDITT
ncbi:MAG: hypothetical protein AAGA71_10430 [Pseudomonadota bacterium]